MFKNQSEENQCICWPFYRLMRSYKVYAYTLERMSVQSDQLVYWTKETTYISEDGEYVCTYIA